MIGTPDPAADYVRRPKPWDGGAIVASVTNLTFKYPNIAPSLEGRDVCGAIENNQGSLVIVSKGFQGIMALSLLQVPLIARSADAPPQPAKPGVAAPAPASASPPAPAPVNNAIRVQLAADVDPEGPKAAWRLLNEKMPSLFSGHTPIYSRANVAGIEFWRLRTGGFTDISAARQFCAAVKAQGAACTVAAF